MTKEEEKRKQLEREENEKEERVNENNEKAFEMQQLLYHNDLLLFRLEQAEEKEEILQKEMNLLANAQKK